jgi:hypothetical protein
MRNSRVLYLLPKENLTKKNGLIFASKDRRNEYQSWQFHVVLEKDGMIYDPDFSNKATPLKTQDYFETMFHDARNDIYVRDIPAMEYMVQYQKIAKDGTMKDSSYFQLRSDEYQTEKLDDFLTKSQMPKLDEMDRIQKDFKK